MATLTILAAVFVIALFSFLAIGFALKNAFSKTKRDSTVNNPPTPHADNNPTPQPQDDSRYMPKPKKALGEQVREIDWFQFEKLIEVAYSSTHTVTRRGGANADGGIDLIIEDATGQKAIQCKHWKSWKVGVRNVRELIGAMADANLKKGILITIKGYSSDAAELAERHAIQLLDEAAVIALLEKADQGRIRAILEDQRKFCPRCENQMVLRTARKGAHTGNKFWGCSEYPKCSYTLPFESIG